LCVTRIRWGGNLNMPFEIEYFDQGYQIAGQGKGIKIIPQHRAR